MKAASTNKSRSENAVAEASVRMLGAIASLFIHPLFRPFCMCSSMPSQLICSGKGLATSWEVASIWSLSCMYTHLWVEGLVLLIPNGNKDCASTVNSHMFRQIRTLGEASSALRTLKWFLSIMHSLVDAQTTCYSKCFPTTREVAHIRF